jgi:hypothetical protein
MVLPGLSSLIANQTARLRYGKELSTSDRRSSASLRFGKKLFYFGQEEQCIVFFFYILNF